MRQRVSGVINEAKNVKRPTQFEQLKLVSLQTEFEYNFGNPDQSAIELENLVDPIELQNWDFSGRYFDQNSLPNQNLFRQQIWALMGVAFYGWYTRGRTDDALKLLKHILKLIQEIDIPTRRPYGTWSRCHYFLAHCYRAKRNFEDAEHHFFESQLYAQRRMKRQQLEVGVDHQYEYLFTTICSARILGAGLSWVAIQQGQLKRALHMLRTAQTLLEATGQEGLKLFVRSLIGLTERRAHAPGSTTWLQGINCLVDCEASFTRLNDRRGQRRCLQELSRAYLDAATMGRSGSRQDLILANSYIEALEALGTRYSDSEPEWFRSNLLRSHLCLLQKDLTGAQVALAEARQRTPSLYSFEYPDETSDLTITEGMYAYEQQMFDEAIGIFQKVLTSIGDLRDPVLEAECLLRLALAQARRGDIRSAREQLQRWGELQPFVDHFFLDIIQQNIYAEIAVHEEVPTITFRSIKFDEAESWFHKEIVRIALARSGGNVTKAMSLTGMKKSTFNRWRSGKKS